MDFKMIQISFVILFITVLDLSFIETNPIDFTDEWDAKITPHSEPLLGDVNRNHILPPISKQDEEKPVELKEKRADRTPKKLGDAVRSRVPCSACRLGVSLLTQEIKAGTAFDAIKVKFVNLCVAFKVENQIVCTGIFDVYAPEILAALQNVQIGPREICSMVIGESCGDVDNPLHEWQIELPDTPKPEKKQVDLSKEGVPTFKVLHLSDTHYDPKYSIASPSNCQEPLCCHNESTPSAKEALIPAQKWGSYLNCDAPKILIDNMLQHITEEHPDIDYIIWTGDLIPHDIWNQTKDGNLAIIQDTVEQMFEHFPSTPIFPALGNHESVPAGNFAPPWMREPDHAIDWLYRRMTDHWRKWLPATSSYSVIHGGFYSVLLRPGFRIISLNTNYCHTLSWWLMVNSTDPAKELEWLVHELQLAENNGEKVHLIGHIPPGSSDCMKVWSRNFYNIINRYEDTIIAQFYGHTHADEFEIFYDINDFSRPINVAYLGPSVTTYENFNPAYRLYYIDGDHDNTTREILDHETWTMNLDEANKNDNPQWYRLYSAKDAYKMNSLRPDEWAKVLDELINNEEMFDKFYRFYYRDSPLKPACDNKCKLQILCDLKSGRSQFRHELCHDLELIFGG